ncbi:hypothetical protein JTF06_11890 [Desemzia sp. RIT804]|uniref:hypothetical protein n=1 Tax=Desemzia sp. RIT 804 TaxID=2810209 RepID=UPI00194DEA2F|nr:hypothetical protein [Desemzia sp. RIT 804]MBM6615586.1 hypothetical protein [Desemzia sp. RIT 804]
MTKDFNGVNLYQILSEANLENTGNSMGYIERSLQRDLILIQAIQTGNKELLTKAIHFRGVETSEKHYYAAPITKGNTLKNRKNGMIIRNTLYRTRLL